jgi:hypothetical protein
MLYIAVMPITRKMQKILRDFKNGICELYKLYPELCNTCYFDNTYF